ncbi:MAG: Gldg family protein [Gammaproteobacteria bacterium]
MGSNDTGARRTPLFGRLGLVALALAFVAGVSLVNRVFHGVQIDLTENRLYTLSEGTDEILGKIAEPVHVYLFYSDKATTNIPAVRTYAGRVREMLEAFAARSDGKLILQVVDPLPFSEEEDRASGFGLRPINVGNSTDPIYLGVAGTNSVGDDDIIPFLDPAKEAFLEYDLAKLVHTLANPKKPVIGLLTELPLTAEFNPMSRQPGQPWVIAEQMRQLFEVRTLDPGLEEIADDIKVLMVVHPKELPDTTLHAIDQFVLGGGRALFFVDPFAEVDPGDANGRRASNLDRLLAAWDIKVDGTTVVADDRYAMTVGLGADSRPVRHLGVLGIEPAAMSPDDIITGNLNLMTFAFPGHISREENAVATLQPLIESSELAGLIPAEQLAIMSDPEMLRAGFKPTGERYVLAARISGKLPSAFPQGLPAPPGSPSAVPAGHLAVAPEPVNVVLVADADLLADQMWVQSQDFFGQRVHTAFANNGDFVINALDNLLGSGDLISIRSRATFQRPFTRVQDLRREADARFRSAEQRLQAELQDTELKLGELQASRTDQGAQILSPEQQAEIERFQDRRLQLRKELRQVQRGLDRDIERLGSLLKLLNIAVVPLLVTATGLLLVVLRRRRQRQAQEAAANQPGRRQ